MRKLFKCAALAVCMCLPAFSVVNAATPVDKVIEETKKSVAPDKRQAIFEISSEQLPGNVIVVKGVTSEPAAKEELMNNLKKTNLTVIDSVKVYPSDKWAQVRVPVACFRTAPGHHSEMATQGILGQPVRLLEKVDDWWRAQTPDGYISYVVDNSLVEKTPAEMEQWRNTPRVIVTAPYQTRVYYTPDLKGLRNVVSDVENGNILLGKKENGKDVVAVTLPDGRKGYIASDDVENFSEWAKQPYDAEKILDLAYSMEGTPYLWGGTSTKTLDCSGLAKVCYFSNGIILMRDASQQATTGEILKASEWERCEPGDLLFFGNARTGRVTHVAIYDKDGNYIHSSGRVKRNSVDPKAESYLSTPFLSVSRIKNSIGQRGITRVENHPWYF